ncbi:hypothetical protein OAK24_02500 [Flavobacteriales bacterium]|nr:hypothetical protein [Flavobacteriales bacterium]
MKKIYLILSVSIVLVTSCETDVDVNAEWEETMVIFGLLDISQDLQFIKINKAFLGEADAYDMASVSDSFNYNPEDIIVKLHKLGSIGDTITTGGWPKTLKDTIIIEKDEGLFASDNNIIYYLETPAELGTDIIYALTVRNMKTGNFVSSNTSLIDEFSFKDEDDLDNYELNFYQLDQAGENVSKKAFDWNPNNTPNAVFYQFALRFNYKENTDTLDLLWQQVDLDASEDLLKLWGRDFFSFLENNLIKDNSVREFIDIDIEMTLGTQDLKTYISVNEPITGIVQQRPLFTNIHNGIGLFSSRSSKVITGLGLKPTTLEYLKSPDGLDRNFQ